MSAREGSLPDEGAEGRNEERDSLPETQESGQLTTEEDPKDDPRVRRLLAELKQQEEEREEERKRQHNALMEQERERIRRAFEDEKREREAQVARELEEREREINEREREINQLKKAQMQRDAEHKRTMTAERERHKRELNIEKRRMSMEPSAAASSHRVPPTPAYGITATPAAYEGHRGTQAFPLRSETREGEEGEEGPGPSSLSASHRSPPAEVGESRSPGARRALGERIQQKMQMLPLDQRETEGMDGVLLKTPHVSSYPGGRMEMEMEEEEEDEQEEEEESPKWSPPKTPCPPPALQTAVRKSPRSQASMPVGSSSPHTQGPPRRRTLHHAGASSVSARGGGMAGEVPLQGRGEVPRDGRRGVEEEYWRQRDRGGESGERQSSFAPGASSIGGRWGDDREGAEARGAPSAYFASWEEQQRQLGQGGWDGRQTRHEEETRRDVPFPFCLSSQTSQVPLRERDYPGASGGHPSAVAASTQTVLPRHLPRLSHEREAPSLPLAMERETDFMETSERTRETERRGQKKEDGDRFGYFSRDAAAGRDREGRGPISLSSAVNADADAEESNKRREVGREKEHESLLRPSFPSSSFSSEENVQKRIPVKIDPRMSPSVKNLVARANGIAMEEESGGTGEKVLQAANRYTKDEILKEKNHILEGMMQMEISADSRIKKLEDVVDKMRATGSSRHVSPSHSPLPSAAVSQSQTVTAMPPNTNPTVSQPIQSIPWATRPTPIAAHPLQAPASSPSYSNGALQPGPWSHPRQVPYPDGGLPAGAQPMPGPSWGGASSGYRPPISVPVSSLHPFAYSGFPGPGPQMHTAYSSSSFPQCAHAPFHQYHEPLQTGEGGAMGMSWREGGERGFGGPGGGRGEFGVIGERSEGDGVSPFPLGSSGMTADGEGAVGEHGRETQSTSSRMKTVQNLQRTPSGHPLRQHPLFEDEGEREGRGDRGGGALPPLMENPNFHSNGGGGRGGDGTLSPSVGPVTVRERELAARKPQAVSLTEEGGKQPGVGAEGGKQPQSGAGASSSSSLGLGGRESEQMERGGEREKTKGNKKGWRESPFWRTVNSFFEPNLDPGC
uniref:Uncharacterized protein n=1 Tax=Chromera velia CCMP2878 TaxID=1169474 RepID=A0A0G4I268_9ALVE|eukprot:Cvel_1704.t1-p1 / transcript=Cvel_1704.t1 / gene=Cvel_1704 / organism=Chromera_velia_CCMP2878 / gene_product=hypothetical protein / transcript_product=hypothetical protein / location=Cvel_scaffold61:111490-116174(-) / protein_length=1077 / sequence_SO=supercontig / SO=protein_coding / is_pseudo=false